MNKTVVSFMMLFYIGTLLSGVMEGAGGINATRLATVLTPIALTITVPDTSGFIKSGWLQIENEKIKYTDKTATTFGTGTAPCTRGWSGTTAATHVVGQKVYSPSASAINSALGFDVASTGATVGQIDLLVVVGSFAWTTMPKLILMDFAWLKEGWLQYIRYMLMMISSGFMIYMAYTIASTLGGILQSIFVRP